MPTWTFVRHGQSVSNVEGWLAGQYDSPLTRHGEAQAVAARDSLPQPVPPRAFCSDLTRAHHTAKLLLQGHATPLVVTPKLRERGLGAWRRRTVAGLREQELDHLKSWRGQPPGGESLFDVAQRVAAWATSVDDSSQPTLVVAHGGLMKAIFAALDGLPRDQLDRGHPDNCQAVQRDIPVGRWAEVLDELRREATQPA
ncbi:MAG: histidine phosphatase family protein [Myxococcota bacterium]